MEFQSIFISDIHLGSKGCKAEYLDCFLKYNTAKRLYLIGDIIDGWKIQQNKWIWKQSHTNVVRRILNFTKNGSEVIYVAGNHDEFLRLLIPYNPSFGRVSLVNQTSYTGIDGIRYLIVHGDMFDGITRLAPWLSLLGDKAYDMLISLNSKFNWLRHKLGFNYWSLSKYLKVKVKKAVNFIFNFENNLVNYCFKKGYGGIICGHIHHAQIKEINGIKYMNDGDWVESCTALVEHLDGTWEIITWKWTKETYVDFITNSSEHVRP